MTEVVEGRGKAKGASGKALQGGVHFLENKEEAMDMNDMLQQAQRMQMELAQAQEEIRELTYTATSGGGMVEATANGDGRIESLTIQPEAIDPEDPEMLQDMILVAVNEALRGVADASESRLASVTGGLNIPGLF